MDVGVEKKPGGSSLVQERGVTPAAIGPRKRTLVEHEDAGGLEPAPLAQPTPATAHDAPPASVLGQAASGLARAVDEYAGSDVSKGAEKDRWSSYGKGDKQTHGWDIGGTHNVKDGGGAASAAITAVSHVEGRYDSVQTYDRGILSFGIMQWTLHAGSLQKFLGFLKDKSGPEGKAAFQADFVDKGIDVKPAGGQYQLWYNGTEYPLGAHDEGRAAIDKLVREDKDTARKWVEIFHTAGADPRVQKAQFEQAKAMFHEAEGVKFSDRVVDQCVKACKGTFHAKYRGQYGQAQPWTSASPKALTLYFSLRVNNPMFANAAFLKAIDAFYDAHGTDRTKWPATWGQEFGDLVAAKSQGTLSSWANHDKEQGRVDKTLANWAPSGGKAAPSEPTRAAPAAHHAHKASPPPHAAQPPTETKVEPSHDQQLHAQSALILQQFQHGQLDQVTAVRHFLAFDQHLNGGAMSGAAVTMLPLFLGELTKATLARSTSHEPPQPAHAPAPQPTAHAPLAAAGAGPAFDKMYTIDKMPPVHVYTPPGGVHGPVEIFLFLHGKFFHHSDARPEADMQLAQAMAATGRNLVTMAPSARQDATTWPMWREVENQQGGYTTLINQTLQKLSADIKADPPLSIKSVSVAGHSAGGSGLGGIAQELGDQVHDITMEDGGYVGGSFDSSHEKLVHWLLEGKTDRLLRVMVHRSVDVGEGRVLKSHINVEHIRKVAQTLKKQVTVTQGAGNNDARTGNFGTTLHHTLRIEGLPGTRQVLVFEMKKAEHWAVRNDTTKQLITQGADTQFAAGNDVATATPAPAAHPPAAHQPAAARVSAAPVRKPAEPAPAKAPADASHPADAVKQVSQAIKAPTDGKAFHDGGKDHELGAGDEVVEQVDSSNHIVAAFSPSPEGMVMAALYELHRGDKRSLVDILADHSAARWEQGKDHAVEQTTKGDWQHGRGLNDDGDATQHGQVVGHATIREKTKKTIKVTKVDAPIGPIQAYKTAAGMGTFSTGKDPMWCGAFVTYCLARCGIDVGTLAYVPSIAGKIAKAKGTLFSFETTMTDDGGGDRHKAKYKYGGAYSEGDPGTGEGHLTKKKLESAETIDIRPGDIFYSAKHTGVIVGVNKQPGSIVVRTVEGNSNDSVVSNVRTIEVDAHGVVVNAPFGGWGRPKQFGNFAAPANQDWITAGKGKKHNDEGKTT